MVEDCIKVNGLKDAYIRLKRKGMSVDVDTMLFPEDRDLFFQVAVPPLPSETGKDPAAAAGSGIAGAPGSGNFESSSRSDNRYVTDATSQQKIVTDSTAANQFKGQYESDSRARVDTTQRLEIKTENVPYPQPTPIVVFVTPPPTPAPSPGTVQKLFAQAQKLAYARRYDLALKEIDRALEIEPSNAMLHALQGSVYYKAGAYDMARGSWYKALQLDPTMYDVKERLNLMSKTQRGIN
jgi:tetratricopeptide (TPR) repeat protein